MKLRGLIGDLRPEAIRGSLDIDIKGLACDSRRVREGYLFIAVPGTRIDGAQFIPEALRRGASCVVYESASGRHFALPAASIKVEDARASQGPIARAFYRSPSRELKVIGITGTNGKTTTSYILEHILLNAGKDVGVIGTINYRFGNGRIIPAGNTTPNALELQSLLRAMADGHREYVLMEVSSHSIAQGRISGIDFSMCIFTNLSQDHLDYHCSMTEYGRTKARLFKEFAPDALAIVNIDDPFGHRLVGQLNRASSFGISDSGGEVRASEIKTSINGSQFRLALPDGECGIHTPLIGVHNVYNILAAACAARGLGINLDEIKRGAESFLGLPGRLEPLSQSGGFLVFVDYAHTEEALRSVLATLRALTSKRLITVFGAGGDRDKSKRPKMGNVVSKFSDYIFITSDNPRGESPEAIADEIIEGIPIEYTNYKVILDRRIAIFEALNFAREGDLILIAGKGHETYQIAGDVIMPFDDRQVAREALVSLQSREKKGVRVIF